MTANSLTRRMFVKGALLCSASTAIAAETNGPHATFPSDPHARIAVATYPFRASIISPHNHDRDPAKAGMDLSSFARFVRTEFGVRGIEPLDSHFSSNQPGEIRKLRAAFDAAGVQTVNIPVDEEVDLCSGGQASRAAGNASYRRWIDAAVLLASPAFASGFPSAVTFPICRKPCKRSSRHLTMQPRATSSSTSKTTIRFLPRTLGSWPRSSRQKPPIYELSLTLPLLIGGDERFNAQCVKRMFAYAWNIAPCEGRRAHQW